jgi:YidC/Oxa1 family membrane protein insertase
MDNQRTILWVLFASMVFLTWTKWRTDNAPPVEAVVSSAQTGDAAQELIVSDLPTAPAAPVDSDLASLPAPEGAQPAPSVNAASLDDTITVSTDVLDLHISKTGGTLVKAGLKKYPLNKDAPDVPVTLLSADPVAQYLLFSGLVDTSRAGPTHLTVLQSDKQDYVLSPGDDSIEVPLRWSANGVTVEKVFTLQRGRYDIGVTYRIRNESDKNWRALSYLQIRKHYHPPERSMFDVDSYSFDGPVIYDGDKYDKLEPDDFADDPVDLTLAGGWLASIQHHFLTAAVPSPDTVFNYDARFDNDIVTIRASSETFDVAPGAEETVKATFFVGPKLQSQLDETAPELSLTVDYGILALLAKPLFWLLEQVHSLVKNWGWSIIIVTFLIKLAFYKLTEASGRSMAKMRKLQPRLKALQDRYKDDRQALSQHMMELYKREKVNPAAGCLPMIVQIPFFIAFYWVLLESVEMRQAPFALWITDLSSRDPFFILPLLMGVAMFVQQKLNPAPPDPVQAKVMMFLPIMFTGFFAFFPSGLVLYWLTNSVLSVVQQWNINRKMAVD